MVEFFLAATGGPSEFRRRTACWRFGLTVIVPYLSVSVPPDRLNRRTESESYITRRRRWQGSPFPYLFYSFLRIGRFGGTEEENPVATKRNPYRP